MIIDMVPKKPLPITPTVTFYGADAFTMGKENTKMRFEIAEKDAKIAELEAELESANQSHMEKDHMVMYLQSEVDVMRQLIADYDAIMEQIHNEEKAREEYIEAKWAKKMAEYPVATTVWKYLTEELYLNNYVAAGILGNMMLECGGNSLNLQYSIYSANKSYYGLCQWNVVAKNNNGVFVNGKVKNASLEKQLEYLSGDAFGSIEYAFNHSKTMDYNTFAMLSNAEKAAEMFAKIYEVCGNTYYTRGVNALKAYQYFVEE